MSWWRAYDESVDDPKLQRMPGELFKAWYNLCCLTSRRDGRLPPVADIAFSLRKTTSQVEKIIADLRSRDLIDETDGMLHPHNWNGRQFKSDVTDPTAAQRQQKYRNKKRDAPVTPTVTVSVTPPFASRLPEQSRDRAETEQSKDALRAPPTGNGVYAFEAGVIRLNQKDFDQWQDAYKHLDLKAELLALEQWAGEQAAWFHAVKGALAKRNREAKAKSGNASELPLTPSGNRWPEGIV